MYFNPKSSKHSISVSSSLSPRAAMYSGLIPPLPGDDPLFASIARSDSLKPTNESMGERFGTEDGSTSRLAGNFSCSCVSTEGLLMSARPCELILCIALLTCPASIRLTTSLLSLAAVCASSSSPLLLSFFPSSLFLASLSQLSTSPPQLEFVTQVNLYATCALPTFPPLVGLLRRP